MVVDAKRTISSSDKEEKVIDRKVQHLCVGLFYGYARNMGVI